MAEPMITCPTCKTEIKLTESLASPLIEATRQKYEEQIRQVRSDLGAREAALRDQQAAIEKERDSIDDEVTRKVTSEIERVSAEERRKARAVVSSDLVQKEQQIAELQEVLDERIRSWRRHRPLKPTLSVNRENWMMPNVRWN